MQIVVDHLNFSYDKAPILKDVSLSFTHGQFYGILGPNGSGKTTLLKLMCGLLPLGNNMIFIQNKALSQYPKAQLAKYISFVPQMFQLKFAFSVRDIVLMGRYPYIKKMASPSIEDFQLVEEALEATELTHLKNRMINELSGGELQRVLIARAIVQDTPFIFLDEPVSHLDIHHQYEIMELLKKICKEKSKTVIAVLHDLNIAIHYCDQVVLLNQGVPVASGTPDQVITRENIEAVYQLKVEMLTQDTRRFVCW